MKFDFLFEFAKIFRELHFELYLLTFAVLQEYNNCPLKTNKELIFFFEIVL